MIYYFIPLVIHLFTLPFWLFEFGVISRNISIIELIILSIGIPICLLLIYAKRKPKKKYIDLIIISIVNVISCMMSYLNWGISTNKVFYPDSETIYIIIIATKMSIIISIVGWWGINVIKFLKLNEENR